MMRVMKYPRCGAFYNNWPLLKQFSTEVLFFSYYIHETVNLHGNPQSNYLSTY